MPTVGRYEGQRVETAALPGVRKTAAATALSEGAGLEQARAETLQTRGQVAGLVGRIGAGLAGQLHETQTRQADEVALLGAERQLGEWESKRLYDPASGALTVKGKDAMPLPEQVTADFDTVASQIAAGLVTPRQKAAFERLRANRGASIDLTLRRHVFGEMQRYEAEELTATVQNAQELAVANAQDPRRVGLELQRAVDAIQTHSRGESPEVTAHKIDAVRTATHVGVIDRLLSTDQTKAAAAYFEEARSQISGEAATRVEKALSEGKLRGQAQTEADRIVGTGGTLTEQRARARELDDPELRDAVMQRIEHEASIQERETREADEGKLRSAYDLVEQHKDVAAIPVALWANLSGGERASLRSYSDHLAKGKPIESDLATYYGLLRKAADDPAGFSTDNLLKYRGSLDEGDFKHLAGLQLSVRSGDRTKTEKDLGGFRTNNQVLEDTLTLYGINPAAKPGTPEDKSIAQLRRMLDQRVQTQQELTGKKPTNEDIQQTLDGLLSQSVKTPGSWWNVFRSGFYPSEKRLIDTTIADVPAAERTQIEGALRRGRRPVSDATVLDLYLELQSRKP